MKDVDDHFFLGTPLKEDTHTKINRLGPDSPSDCSDIFISIGLRESLSNGSGFVHLRGRRPVFGGIIHEKSVGGFLQRAQLC